MIFRKLTAIFFRNTSAFWDQMSAAPFVVVSCRGGSSPRHVFSLAEEARTLRSRGIREGQENMCLAVCGAVWREGQRLSGALPTPRDQA